MMRAHDSRVKRIVLILFVVLYAFFLAHPTTSFFLLLFAVCLGFFLQQLCPFLVVTINFYGLFGYGEIKKERDNKVEIMDFFWQDCYEVLT